MMQASDDWFFQNPREESRRTNFLQQQREDLQQYLKSRSDYRPTRQRSSQSDENYGALPKGIYSRPTANPLLGIGEKEAVKLKIPKTRRDEGVALGDERRRADGDADAFRDFNRNTNDTYSRSRLPIPNRHKDHRDETRYRQKSQKDPYSDKESSSYSSSESGQSTDSDDSFRAWKAWRKARSKKRRQRRDKHDRHSQKHYDESHRSREDILPKVSFSTKNPFPYSSEVALSSWHSSDHHRIPNLSRSVGDEFEGQLPAAQTGSQNNKKEQYRRELEEQMRLKREQKDREKAMLAELDRKKELEIQSYDPFGKEGAGAPIKVRKGSITKPEKDAAMAQGKVAPAPEAQVVDYQSTLHQQIEQRKHSKMDQLKKRMEEDRLDEERLERERKELAEKFRLEEERKVALAIQANDGKPVEKVVTKEEVREKAKLDALQSFLKAQAEAEELKRQRFQAKRLQGQALVKGSTNVPDLNEQISPAQKNVVSSPAMEQPIQVKPQEQRQETAIELEPFRGNMAPKSRQNSKVFPAETREQANHLPRITLPPVLTTPSTADVDGRVRVVLEQLSTIKQELDRERQQIEMELERKRKLATEDRVRRAYGGVYRDPSRLEVRATPRFQAAPFPVVRPITQYLEPIGPVTVLPNIPAAPSSSNLPMERPVSPPTLQDMPLKLLQSTSEFLKITESDSHGATLHPSEISLRYSPNLYPEVVAGTKTNDPIEFNVDVTMQPGPTSLGISNESKRNPVPVLATPSAHEPTPVPGMDLFEVGPATEWLASDHGVQFFDSNVDPLICSASLRNQYLSYQANDPGNQSLLSDSIILSTEPDMITT